MIRRWIPTIFGLNAKIELTILSFLTEFASTIELIANQFGKEVNFLILIILCSKYNSPTFLLPTYAFYNGLSREMIIDFLLFHNTVRTDIKCFLWIIDTMGMGRFYAMTLAFLCSDMRHQIRSSHAYTIGVSCKGLVRV